MVIWGGVSFFDVSDLHGPALVVGGMYDPAQDAWSRVTTVHSPSPRGGHTAVWTGQEMLIWGGQQFQDWRVDEFYNTGGRYNPATNTWTPMTIANAPEPRSFHTAVWTGEEMIVWGGISDWGLLEGIPRLLNTGGRYRP